MERPSETESGYKVSPDSIKAAIEKHRNTLDEADFEFLLGLYEVDGDFMAYAKEINCSGRDVHQKFALILASQENTPGKVSEKKGPVIARKDGRSLRKRLTPRELRVILDEYNFTLREKLILEARIQSTNQTMAAFVLEQMLLQELLIEEKVTYSQYVTEYMAIREKYDF